jgi:aromatic ring-opening dioxygenase LigB subunit
MALVFAALLPHPKALASQEKSLEYKKTRDAFTAARNSLLAKKTDTILFVSARPIGPLDAFSAPPSNPGALSMPGLDRIQVGLPHLDASREPLVLIGDVDLNRAVIQGMKVKSVMVEKTPHSKLEEPSSLALYALDIFPENELMISYAGLPYHSPKKLLGFGKILGEILKAYTKNVAVIAVADLSARLSTESTAGFSESAKKFDDAVLAGAKENSFDDVLSLSETELESAGEEAARPLAVLVGATGQTQLRPRAVSYEAPHGIGHAVLTWS